MGRKLESVLKGFTAQKCLTLLKLTTPRITISRNRRAIAVRQMRGQIAQLLKSGQATQVYDTKIDSLIREENIVAAYDLLDHFCHSIICQFPAIEMQRYCPPDLKEPIATLIYAAPRCAELAELNQVKDMLTTKYGKEFAIAAEEIQPECGVNRQIIEMLSMRPASEQTKVRKMKEICAQQKIEWRQEWAPGGASVMPPSDFRDASSRARIDNRRAASNEGSINSQPAEAASSSVKAHPHRGSSHGEVTRANMRVSESMNEPYRVASPGFGPKSNPLSREEVTRADIRVSEGGNEPYRPASPRFGQKGSSLTKEDVRRANRVSESIHEPYTPGFGTKPSSLPKEELPKANMRFSEGVDEPYRPSPGFGTKIPKEEVTRANTRVSEDMNEPYEPAYGSKHSSLPRANIKISESMDEPYKPGFRPKYGSLPREEAPRDNVPRANMRVSEGIYEPNKPSAASFGSYKAADYKQDVHEDRAEYRMQHHDEISDSGSEVFVSVEEDEVVKDDVSSTMTKNSFEGKTEDYSSNSNLRARSLRASRETSLSREGSSLKASKDENSFRVNDQIEEHYTHKNQWVEEQSFKASKGIQSNDPRIVNIVPTAEKIVHKSASLSSDRSEEKDDFASTAKSIAAEAARLAVLNYARRYSRSGSISTDLGDLTEDALESMEEKVVYPKTKVGDYDDDGDRHMDSMGFKRDSTKEKYNRPSKTAADHVKNYQNHVQYGWGETENEAERPSYKAASNADVNPFSRKSGDDEAVNQVHISKNESPSLSVKKEREELERNTQRRHGEKPQFNNERHHDYVNTKFNETSPPTYNHGKPRYDVQGKNAEGPPFDQATYRQRQFSKESSKPYNVGSMSEKKPIFDEEPDLYFGSPRRNKDSQEMLDQREQHRSSSKFKEDNSYNEHEPYFDGKAREEKPSYPDQMRHDIGRRQMRKPHGIRQHEYESEKIIGAKSVVQAADSQAMRKSSSSSLRGAPDQEEDLHDKAQLRRTNADPNASRGRFMSDRAAESPGQFAQRQQMTQEDSDEDEHYAKDRNCNAAPKHDSSMRARTQTDHVVSSMSSRSSKMIHQHSEKKILDDVLSAKWHGDDVSTSTEGAYNIQDKSQEPATRNKPLAQDSYMGKRTPSQQKHHEREPDLVSVYTPRGQVDDLVKRIPSNSTSVWQQSRCEDVQVTASGYKPYVQHNGRRTATLQKQEEQGSPSKYNVGDQQHRQGKNRNEQDSWPERERPHNHKEHQKPTFDQGATSMSPNHRHEPPTRKPPPLPQNNTSISDRKRDPEATGGQQHSLSESQKKEEEEGAYERNNSAMLDRRSQQSTRPPPPVMVSTPRVNDRERPAKLDKEGSWPPTRQPPEIPTRKASSPLEKSVSDSVISSSKHPSSSSASASSKSTSAHPPAPAAPMVPPKLPHIDDIAANLDALRQAKLARLRKPN